MVKAGPYNITIVQGKTFRLRLQMTDEAGDPMEVSQYEWRAKVKADYDGTTILFLSSNPLLAGLTTASEITLEPDGNTDEIELVVADETMEGILHTVFTAKTFGSKIKYVGVWELEREDSLSPGDTNPVLAGSVRFIREVVR